MKYWFVAEVDLDAYEDRNTDGKGVRYRDIDNAIEDAVSQYARDNASFSGDWTIKFVQPIGVKGSTARFLVTLKYK